MLNCEEITRLVSASFERKLTFGERMNLWMHISMCGTCRLFRRLQRSIHEVIRQGLQATDQTLPAGERLSDESRSRIRQTILSARDEGHDASAGK